MRPTRRGWTALAIVVTAVVLAYLFGARSLNAVVAPLLVAFLVGVVQVVRADAPTVDLEGPRPGFPDEARRLSVQVDGTGLATVSLALPPGLAGANVDATVSLPHAVEREVTLLARGVYTLGPVQVTQRGPLGLVGRRVDAAPTAEAVVFPRRYAVAGQEFASLFADELEAERQEFDRLREYVPGDPLRNVHWKSSAKHDEYLVMEFAPDERTETVTVAASATPGNADAMASAAASVVELALEADHAVGLTLPDETVPPGQGDDHRETVLRALARTGPGRLPEETHAEADVSIWASDQGTTLQTDQGAYDFWAVATDPATRGGIHA